MSTDLLRRLDRWTRTRIPLATVRREFFSLYPDMVGNPNRNALLLDVLRTLETAGLVQLPAPGSWERLGNPPMPNWVQVIRDIPVRERADFAAIPWVPELGFWPELKPAMLEAARAINDFLLEHRGRIVAVPIKERSLEIFGDEKRLDSMRRGNTLFSGRLPLEVLGALVVPLPLPLKKADAPGKPVLIVENHNSYWSFGQWNLKMRRYAAIVFGSGEAFRSSGRALGDVLEEVNGVGAEYLGDLDPKGIAIPLEFNAAAEPGSPLIVPAMEFYTWLIEYGVLRERTSEMQAEARRILATTWLGSTLGGALADLWNEGYWIPQESLGFQALSSMSS